MYDIAHTPGDSVIKNSKSTLPYRIAHFLGQSPRTADSCSCWIHVCLIFTHQSIQWNRLLNNNHCNNIWGLTQLPYTQIITNHHNVHPTERQIFWDFSLLFIMTSSTLQPTFLKSNPLYLLIFISICDCVEMGCVCAPQHICENQTLTCGNQFSPTTWVPGFELRLSDLDSNYLYTK